MEKSERNTQELSVISENVLSVTFVRDTYYILENFIFFLFENQGNEILNYKNFWKWKYLKRERFRNEKHKYG